MQLFFFSLLNQNLVLHIDQRNKAIERKFKLWKFKTHYESCVGAPMILQLKRRK